MTFCTQCGNQVGVKDSFCAKCGARQAITSPSPSAHSHGNAFVSGLTPRTAAMLCYIPVIGWIPCIFVLAADRFQNDRAARFHAFQGLYLFVVWLLVDRVVSPIFRFGSDFNPGHILQLVVFGAWIFMLVKTSQQQMFRLPIVGELADRSVAEQR